jgi:hypothetical protein
MPHDDHSPCPENSYSTILCCDGCKKTDHVSSQGAANSVRTPQELYATQTSEARLGGLFNPGLAKPAFCPANQGTSRSVAGEEFNAFNS